MFPVLAIIALFYIQASSSASVGCGRQHKNYEPKTTRIINGVQAKANSWPWTVSFQGVMQNHFCGGSLLRVKENVEQSDIFLTAAHCIPKISTNGKPVGPYLKPYTILVGNHAHSALEKGKERISIADFRIHQNYSKIDKVNDIALVKLIKPVSFTDTVRPVCLPQHGDPIATGQTCVAAGWGRNDTEDERSLSNELQQLVVPIHDQNKCFQKWVRVYNKDLMTCAGALDGSATVCNGDSGGPLVCQASDGSWVQQGVANFVASCTSKQPPVYARVSAFAKWISEQISEMTSVN